MKEVRLAFIGFGNVAQGLTQILHLQEQDYADKFGVRFLITAITDTSKGGAFDPDGLRPGDLLAALEQPGALRSLPGTHPEWDAIEMIENSPSDVLVEMSVTNLKTGEPATTYISEALRRKKNVVTTNKGPIALHYDNLANIARLHNVMLGVEGTVMSGTPVLRLGRELLAGAGIQRVQGILNGTTNYILTRMEAGFSYNEALAEAQSLGFAEADPTGDVEGYDAAAKVAILSRLVFGVTTPLDAIDREGITRISVDDVARAKSAGEHWKLVGTIENRDGQLTTSVRPQRLPAAHPLAGVSGATNALVYTTRYLNDVTMIGPGAGRMETGFAVLQDLFSMYRDDRD